MTNVVRLHNKLLQESPARIQRPANIGILSDYPVVSKEICYTIIPTIPNFLESFNPTERVSDPRQRWVAFGAQLSQHY